MPCPIQEGQIHPIPRQWSTNQCLHVSTWPLFMTILASKSVSACLNLATLHDKTCIISDFFCAVKKIYLNFPEIGQRRDQIYTKGSKDKSNEHHSSFESVSFCPVSADHEAHSQYILRREQEQKGFRGRNCCILLQLPRLAVFKQIKRFYSNYGIQFKWGRLQDFKCQLDWRQKLRTTKVVTRTSVSPSSHSHVTCNLIHGGVSVTLCHIGSSTGKITGVYGQVEGSTGINFQQFALEIRRPLPQYVHWDHHGVTAIIVPASRDIICT